MGSSAPGTEVGRDPSGALGSRSRGHSLPSFPFPAQPHFPPKLFPVTPIGGCSLLNGHVHPPRTWGLPRQAALRHLPQFPFLSSGAQAERWLRLPYCKTCQRGGLASCQPGHIPSCPELPRVPCSVGSVCGHRSALISPHLPARTAQYCFLSFLVLFLLWRHPLLFPFPL